MEPDERPLTDSELDGLLPAWRAPAPPAGMRSRILPSPPLPWWQRFWRGSIRIPIPVAAAIALLLAVILWPRVVREASPTGVPRAEGSRQALTFNELRPVAELRPRIVGDQRRN